MVRLNTVVRPWRRLCFVLLVGAIASCAEEPKVFSLANGESRSLSDHANEWVVINYWAEWCAPCREEIPELNQLHEENQGKLTVYGVNYDGLQGQDLNALGGKMGISFPLLAQDPGAELGYERPQVLPTTVLISPTGIIETRVGPQTKEGLLQAAQ